MLGQDHVSSGSLDIDQKVAEKYVISDEDERKQKHLMRKLKKKGYKDLQLATTKLAFQVVSLAETVNLPNGSLAKAWTALKDEYDPSEGEDKIKLLEDFQNNRLLNAEVNITERFASLSNQVMKLNKLSHSISDDYLMTRIFASLPPVYSSVVDHAKIDFRKHTLDDTIYIKTQVFRLLRYYSPVPRNIARSDWVTQNITHNMTSSLI